MRNEFIGTTLCETLALLARDAAFELEEFNLDPQRFKDLPQLRNFLNCAKSFQLEYPERTANFEKVYTSKTHRRWLGLDGTLFELLDTKKMHMVVAGDPTVKDIQSRAYRQGQVDLYRAAQDLFSIHSKTMQKAQEVYEQMTDI